MTAFRATKAPASRRSMCRDCGRQVDLVTQPDGAILKVDTEVRSVVIWPGGQELQTVRLPHAGMCRPESRERRTPRRGGW